MMKQFVKRIIGRLDIGIGMDQVGIVEFSDTAKSVFNLTTYSTKADMYKAITDTMPMGGNTYTGLGLRYV